MTIASIFPDDATATFSPCKRYRYRLSRCWDYGLPECLFVMLNPSTATEHELDPTIRRCVAFAKMWGCGSLWVGNLFAYRATEPKDMLAQADPVGPGNLDHVEVMCRRVLLSRGKVVVAWGVYGRHRDQDVAVVDRLRASGASPLALRLTKDGDPSHPLYIPYDVTPITYEGRSR